MTAKQRALNLLTKPMTCQKFAKKLWPFSFELAQHDTEIAASKLLKKLMKEDLVTMGHRGGSGTRMYKRR